MARVHTITGSADNDGKFEQCSKFYNRRNGCTYKTCKRPDGRWVIQPNPSCKKKRK